MKNRIIIFIGRTVAKIDWLIFHADIPWDIYVETQMDAFTLREYRKKKGKTI